MQPGQARGLTLVEVLVAVAILAVLSALAVAAAGGIGDARRVDREAERFSALVTLACERAALGGRTYGIHLGRSGYAFSRRFGADWRIERDNVLRARVLPSGLVFELRRADLSLPLTQDPPPVPQGWCQPSGELAPLVVSLRAREGAPAARIRLDADGRIRRDAEG